MFAWTSSNGPIQDYSYEYDAAGNVKQVREEYMANTAMNRVVTNAYDSINRLTEEAVTGNGATTTSFVYDDAHNRESMTKGGVLTSYSYNSLNQLTGWSDGTKTSSYTYDDNGNRTLQTISGVPVAGLYWDYENRVVAFEKPVAPGLGIYAFYLDYRSRRVGRVYGSAATKIVFSGGVAVRELSGTTPVVDYVRGSDWGGGVGGILYSVRGGVPSFTHYNRRGDVTAKTDATGAITYQSQYEAFGKRTTETGATLDPQKSNTKDEDFPGYANEGFRFRDLETGVFLSRDPAGFVDGPNLYTYVVQNPWTGFDPEGLWVNYAMSVTAYVVFQGWDTFQMARGNISKTEFGLRSTANAAGLGVDLLTGGGGKQALGRTALVAGAKIAAAEATKIGAGTAANAALHAGLEGSNLAAKSDGGSNGGASDRPAPSESAKDTNKQTAQERGRQSETRVLDDIGEVKNTEKVTGNEGNSIPDFQNQKQIGEIKDTKVVNDSKQLRIQREAAETQRKEHIVVTGENTRVSKTVQSQSNVTRRPDLGPQKEKGD